MGINTDLFGRHPPWRESNIRHSYQVLVLLKGLAYADLAKNYLIMNCCCFMYDFSVALISAVALFEIRQFKTK